MFFALHCLFLSILVLIVLVCYVNDVVACFLFCPLQTWRTTTSSSPCRPRSLPTFSCKEDALPAACRFACTALPACACLHCLLATEICTIVTIWGATTPHAHRLSTRRHCVIADGKGRIDRSCHTPSLFRSIVLSAYRCFFLCSSFVFHCHYDTETFTHFFNVIVSSWIGWSWLMCFEEETNSKNSKREKKNQFNLG